jgi:hypothetical protein
MTDDSGVRKSAPGWTTVLSFIPLALASTLALLYGLGATLRAGELRGAEVNVRDTLPLFTIDQLLARGIYAGVVALPIIALIAIPAAGIAFLSTATPLRERFVRRPLSRRSAGGLMAVLLPTTMLLAPPLGALGGGIAGFIAGYLGGRGRYALSVAAGLAIGGVFLLTNAVLEPQRFPDVTIILADKGVVRGKLLVHSRGEWYVATGPRRIMGLPDGEALRVRIRSAPHRRWQPGHKLIRRAWAAAIP